MKIHFPLNHCGWSLSSQNPIQLKSKWITSSNVFKKHGSILVLWFHTSTQRLQTWNSIIFISVLAKLSTLIWDDFDIWEHNWWWRLPCGTRQSRTLWSGADHMLITGKHNATAELLTEVDPIDLNCVGFDCGTLRVWRWVDSEWISIFEWTVPLIKEMYECVISAGLMFKEVFTLSSFVVPDSFHHFVTGCRFRPLLHKIHSTNILKSRTLFQGSCCIVNFQLCSCSTLHVKSVFSWTPDKVN